MGLDPNHQPTYETREVSPKMNPAPLHAAGLTPSRRALHGNPTGKGVKRIMTRPEPFKVGRVSIRPERSGEWTLRYRTNEGRDVRRKLKGMKRREVELAANHINAELARDGGFLPRKAPPVPTVAEAFTEAIRLRPTNKATTRDRSQRAMKFLSWLRSAYPHTLLFSDLRPGMVQGYVTTLERRGLSHYTIRLDLAPVKIAWRHIHENFPETIKPLPRIRLSPPPPSRIDCLEPGDVEALFGWTRENAPDVHAIAILCGLSGLRLLEASALRLEDVDLERRTVTITDTGVHRPKNRASWRTIPIPREVADAIASAIRRQKVRPLSGEIFLNRRGNPWDKNTLSPRLRVILNKAARATKRPEIARLPARKLRAFFATTAARLGASDRALQAYLGHSGGTILAEHYRRISIADLATIPALMENWRTLRADQDAWHFPGISESEESANG